MDRRYRILLKGKSTTGKTTSLEFLQNQENWLYINTDCGKDLPFKNNFKIYNVTEALDFFGVIEQVCLSEETKKKYLKGGVIIDVLNYAMDMFESQVINVGENKEAFELWSQYGDYFRTMMFEHIAKFNAPAIFLAHVYEERDAFGNIVDASVPVKGGLKKTSLEAFFDPIIQTRKIDLDKIKQDQNEFYTISEEEKDIGIKYVYQVSDTKDNKEAKIRTPRGLFNRRSPFINANMQMFINALDKYKQ